MFVLYICLIKSSKSLSVTTFDSYNVEKHNRKGSFKAKWLPLYCVFHHPTSLKRTFHFGRKTLQWISALQNVAHRNVKQRILEDIEQNTKSDNQELNHEKLPKEIDSKTFREKLSEINKKLKEPTKKQEK